MKVNSKTQKIVVTGPESSGKTTLAKQLAKNLEAPWVPEYARTYLEHLEKSYQAEDILKIGQAQATQHHVLSQQQPNYMICDTSFLVLHIWFKVKYQQSNAWLEAQFLSDPVALYLLCEPDIPWTFDPLRENPDDRYVLFELYERALKDAQKPYQIISGSDRDQRLAMAQRAVKAIS